MTPAPDQYPHDLSGEPADPPGPVPADLLEAWRTFEAAERAALEAEPPLFAAGSWRVAPALEQLLREANAANPGRDRSSDGSVGDLRHQALKSDHNPDARAVVCARDFDVDGLDVPAAFERARQAVLAGQLPQLVGGYLIHAARITSPDFRRWNAYEGDNPHVTHGHVSVSHDPKRADDARAWNVWTPPRATTPSPAPTPPRNNPPAPTGDLRGRGVDLRGEQGAQGPRVAALQNFLRIRYRLYAKALVVDGVWGPRTSAVLDEFARRSGIPESDGLNVGPKLARALLVAGFRG